MHSVQLAKLEFAIELARNQIEHLDYLRTSSVRNRFFGTIIAPSNVSDAIRPLLGDATNLFVKLLHVISHKPTGSIDISGAQGDHHRFVLAEHVVHVDHISYV
jgi:hypothetical protein